MARLCLLLDAHIKDDEQEWVTINGTPVPIDENGNITGGPARLRKESESRSESGGSSENSAGKRGSNNFTRKELTDYLRGNPKENEAATNKHVMGDEYISARNEALSRGDRPKSCFTISTKSLRAQVKNKLKAGDFTIEESNRGDLRAIIKFDKPVGTVYNKTNGQIGHQQTKRVMLSCSKEKGYHMYPVNEEGD